MAEVISVREFVEETSEDYKALTTSSFSTHTHTQLVCFLWFIQQTWTELKLRGQDLPASGSQPGRWCLLSQGGADASPQAEAAHSSVWTDEQADVSDGGAQHQLLLLKQVSVVGTELQGHEDDANRCGTRAPIPVPHVPSEGGGGDATSTKSTCSAGPGPPHLGSENTSPPSSSLESYLEKNTLVSHSVLCVCVCVHG